MLNSVMIRSNKNRRNSVDQWGLWVCVGRCEGLSKGDLEKQSHRGGLGHSCAHGVFVYFLGALSNLRHMT
jgi:hypothetical protein